MLRPVLSAAENRSTQRTLDSFLSFNQRFAKIQSKRLARAVRGIAGGALPEVRLGPDYTPLRLELYQDKFRSVYIRCRLYDKKVLL